MGGDRRDDREFPDDFYPKLLGAVFPEAVRQAQEERRRREQAEMAEVASRLLTPELFEGMFNAPLDWSGAAQVGTVRPTPPSPLPSWRARTPAEVAEYDRRFLHVLGIEWAADLSGAPRS